jgi:hypothetical protein
MSAKLVPTFMGRGCREVSATDPPAANLNFLDPGRTHELHKNGNFLFEIVASLLRISDVRIPDKEGGYSV